MFCIIALIHVHTRFFHIPTYSDLVRYLQNDDSSVSLQSCNAKSAGPRANLVKRTFKPARVGEHAIGPAVILAFGSIGANRTNCHGLSPNFALIVSAFPERLALTATGVDPSFQSEAGVTDQSDVFLVTTAHSSGTPSENSVPALIQFSLSM